MKRTLVVLLVAVAGCSSSSGGGGFVAPSTAAAPAAPSTTTTTAPSATAPPLTPPASGGAVTVAAASPKAPVLAAPARAAGAASGREFLLRTKALPRIGKGSREEAILDELTKGNLPSFLRTFVPVAFTTSGALGNHVVTVWVLPDYLAIGSDADHVRIPMGAPTAQLIADRFQCLLPTRTIVDRIYEHAAIKLTPRPLPPGATMMSNEYYEKEEDLIEAQLVGKKLGSLVAGHKKDVILSTLIATHPGKVIIYGWHQLTGQPIQPRSSVHEATYADYSHGIRLVHPEMQIDGKTVKVVDVLKDATLAKLISDEGVVAQPRY